MAILHLPPVLTHAQANACREQLFAAMSAQQDKVLCLNASALAQFDSSALAVMLACRRQALAIGKTLSVQDLPQRLNELARLYGVLDWLQS